MIIYKVRSCPLLLRDYPAFRKGLHHLLQTSSYAC